MRVLVADDCDDTRSTLAYVFRELGHEVFAASNGAQAVELAIEHAPHVAFLDIAMPVMNGHEAAERIHRLYPDMPLFALTGWPAREDSREKDAVFHRYLVKPVGVPELVELLDPRAAWPGPLPHDIPRAR